MNKIRFMKRQSNLNSSSKSERMIPLSLVVAHQIGILTPSKTGFLIPSSSQQRASLAKQLLRERSASSTTLVCAGSQVKGSKADYHQLAVDYRVNRLF